MKPRWPPPDPARAPHVGEGPRVLLVADEHDLAARAQLRSTAPHLAAAGYRLSFVPVGRGAPLAAVGEQLRARAYALVHVHGARLAPAAWMAGLLSSGPPLVVSLREPPGACGVRRWLLGRALARADAIVAACEDDRAAVLRRFPNLRWRQGRIVVIAAGVEGPSVREADGDEEETVIGCSVTCERGRDLLLEAVDRLARFGNVPPFRVEAFAAEADQALGKAVAARGLGHLIDVLPAASGGASQAGLFVALSRADAQAAMQALCAGVPLLAPDCAGLRELLAGSPARVYSPNGAASLETALREALGEPGDEEARRYAPAARGRFDAGRAAARLVELYDRLTATEPAVAAARESLRGVS